MAHISAKAIIEDGATLADDVVVGPFSYIGPEVTLGAGCVIGNSVTLLGKTVLGEKTRVYPMASVGSAGEDGQCGECVIGEACSIREHVGVYTAPDRPTVIGKNNLIMIGSQVGAGSTIGDHGLFANLTHIGEDTCVEEYVRTSGFSYIDDGVFVGAYTFIGGFSAIDHDAPPFAMLMGSPYRVRGVNTENLRRCGFDQDDIKLLKQAFRELFNGAGETADPAIARRLMEEHAANPQIARLAAFVLRARPGGKSHG